MKKILIAFMATTLFSCSNDENICCPVTPDYHWETITCDTEDNIIKINNVWLHNSNLDWSNWQYFQARGFKLDDNQLQIVTTDGSKILQAELFNVNPTLLTVTRPNDHIVIFYSADDTLFNSGDVYDVNLKIAD